MRSTLLTFALLAAAPLAWAQEAGSEAEKATPEEAARPRPSIRVLQHPYEIGSFYRSGGSAPGGWAGLSSDPAYAVAGFYRSGSGSGRSPYGWSRFWTNGYGAPRRAPLPSFRRSIGHNGDLFLVVPFLAPVGPLSSTFFEY